VNLQQRKFHVRLSYKAYEQSHVLPEQPPPLFSSLTICRAALLQGIDTVSLLHRRLRLPLQHAWLRGRYDWRPRCRWRFMEPSSIVVPRFLGERPPHWYRRTERWADL
jgi:hypothetical protein